MRESAANGSLMRVSPIGILAHAVVDGGAVWARDDSALTHPNLVCLDSVAVFVVAVSHAVSHGDGFQAAYRAGFDWAIRAGAERAVIERLERAKDEVPVCDAESQ